jgi:hypothetical protein
MNKGLILMTSSVVVMLLGFGLCANVPGEQTDWRVWTGLFLVVGGFISFLVSCAVIGQHRRSQSKKLNQNLKGK